MAMSTDTPTAASPAADETTESFEEILRRLKQVVERLEGGELALEDALRSFEDGVRLTRQGTAILDAAERRVEMLVGNRLEPFPDPPGGSPGAGDPRSRGK
jgi:exodeoxyribonuclease VII small subunit